MDRLSSLRARLSHLFTIGWNRASRKVRFGLPSQQDVCHSSQINYSLVRAILEFVGISTKRLQIPEIEVRRTQFMTTPLKLQAEFLSHLRQLGSNNTTLESRMHRQKHHANFSTVRNRQRQEFSEMVDRAVASANRVKEILGRMIRKKLIGMFVNYRL